MAKSKKKKKKYKIKKRNQVEQTPIEPRSKIYSENHLFIVIVLMNYISGLALGFTLKTQNTFGIVLVTVLILAADRSATMLKRLHELKPLKTKTSSVGELKESITENTLSEDAERKRVKWQFTITIYLQLGGYLALFWLSHSPVTIAITIGVGVLIVLLRVISINSPRFIFLHCILATLLISILPILGILVQNGTFHPEVFLVGFVPGTILAASIVAKHSKTLLEAGWRRNYEYKKKGSEQTLIRPKGLVQMYSMFLVLGIFVSVFLASFGLAPAQLMFSAVIVLLIPKVATKFLHASAPDEEISTQTLKLAVISSSLMLIVGLIASGV